MALRPVDLADASARNAFYSGIATPPGTNVPNVLNMNHQFFRTE